MSWVSVGLDKICPVCKKVFLAQPEWIYIMEKNSKRTYFCTYKCFRKFQKSKEKKVPNE